MHWTPQAFNLPLSNVGSSSAARMAMTEMTTSNSISVNARPIETRLRKARYSLDTVPSLADQAALSNLAASVDLPGLLCPRTAHRRALLPVSLCPCLMRPKHADMNEPKANSSGRGKDAQPLIYVVDDEPMLLEMAAVILEPLGYKVKTFRDGESAVEAFTSARPKP